MRKGYLFWLWMAAIIQIVTAGIHALSFVIERAPADAAERELIDLMQNHRFDMGAGFHPSMHNLYEAMSASFAFLYLLGGLINITLIRRKVAPEVLKDVTGVNIIVYGLTFLVTFILTFLPPIVMTGVVFLSLCFAYATNHIHLFSNEEKLSQ